MRTQLAILAFFLSLYLLTSGGHTYSSDEESMFFVSAAMARRGGFDTPAIQDAPVSPPMRGVDGKLYAPYGLLPSAVALPLFDVGNTLTRFFPIEYSGYITRFMVTLWPSPLFTALTALLMFNLLTSLGFGFRVALITVLLYGSGTMAWVYAKTFFSEPLGTLLIFNAFVCLSEYRRRARRALLVASGVSLGLAVATKIAAAIAIPVLGVYLAWIVLISLTRPDPRERLGTILAWGAPLALLIGGVAFYNLERFGNPFETGYGMGSTSFTTPLDVGLNGLLLSPGKSLFLYSPIVLAAIPAFWIFGRTHRSEALVCAGIVLAHLIFYAQYAEWHGDSAWGPRFMVFILPFLLVPVAALVEWLAPPVRRNWRILFGLLVIISVLVQALGIAVNFDTYINSGVPATARFYDPTSSPLLGQWYVLISNLNAGHPAPPMPEGAIRRFGWFFDPGLRHPPDFWFLYVLYSGLPAAQIAALVAPLLLVCLALQSYSVRALWRRARASTI